MQNLGCDTRDIQPVRDEARRICEKAGDRNGVAAAWRQEGNLMIAGHRLEEAAQCYLRALDLVRQTGYRTEMVHLLNGLGTISLERGDFRGAESSFTEGLRIAKENKRGYLELQVPLSEALRAQGRLAEAEIILSETLTEARSTGDRETLGLALVSLGEVKLWRGDQAASARAFESGIAELRVLGNPEMLDAALTSFARQRLVVGDLRRARVLLDEPRKTGHRREELSLGLAELALAEGRTGDCARLALEAVEESRRAVNLGTQAEAWIERALALHRLGSPLEAEDALGRAVPLVSRWPDPQLQLRLSAAQGSMRSNLPPVSANLQKAARL
jgi:tetratricopeptide (TPR) repeat protein